MASQGMRFQPASRRAQTWVLIDTSGSMDAPNRLPLVKQSLGGCCSLSSNRRSCCHRDLSGNAGTALEPTAASEKGKILSTIERLQAGGSTAAPRGSGRPMRLRSRTLIRRRQPRDPCDRRRLQRRDHQQGRTERLRRTSTWKGIFLSVLVSAWATTTTRWRQALAQNGNGTAAYIDTINEARKVLVEEATSTLIPIAKDVKIQVEFNPATVAEYRLIGYETRLLSRDDFTNDKVDAGRRRFRTDRNGPLRDRPDRWAARRRRLALRDTSRSQQRRQRAVGRVCISQDALQTAQSDVSALVATPIDHTPSMPASKMRRWMPALRPALRRLARFCGVASYRPVRLRRCAAGRLSVAWRGSVRLSVRIPPACARSQNRKRATIATAVRSVRRRRNNSRQPVTPVHFTLFQRGGHLPFRIARLHPPVTPDASSTARGRRPCAGVSSRCT